DLEAVPTYTTVAGRIYSEEEHVDIPVVLYVMKQPHSYTKEDVVEVHTLGSPLLVKMALDAILTKGILTKKNIRFAQPGEFTKRAFLHGRIDLTQAEAVMQLIRAQTDDEREVALTQLSGAGSHRINHIRNEIVSLCAEVEAAIDFSDQDIEITSLSNIIYRLTDVEASINRLLLESETGKVDSEGIEAVLYGKPNAGKSSLINALLGKRRSLVSDEPGTTRDVVTDILEINGIHFRLSDTAGIGNTQDVVASGAMDKTHTTMKQANLLLLVLDGSGDIEAQLDGLELDVPGGNTIIVFNKSDKRKAGSLPELPLKLRKYPLIQTSALTGEGLEALKTQLAASALGGDVTTRLPGGRLAFNRRQREALNRSLQSVRQAKEAAENNESYEFIAMETRSAIDALGEIVGEVTTEDILDKIFSEFCIGK
ncbi:MAG TPA: tRNA uridine-5-carboxymethylaminomethyl(34) synthesis GTPase MnmE, partial [Candidatus Brocadiaceae bacterium]|nr:tRNA uridine-5-carboxymethylaminomethyl(34) synthesis GTPase MnmE [Candidatus Brocadiaceae bacterium]